MPPAYVGLIVHPTYRIRDGVPVVLLYGRLDDGPAFLVEDDRFRPYFFAPLAARGLLAGEPRVRAEETALRTLAGAPVLRVEVELPGDVPRLRDRLSEAGLPAQEADLRFPYRYLIDRGLRAGVAIEGEPTPGPGGLLVFRNAALAPAETKARPRMVSLDLETALDVSSIWSAALFGEGIDEVHVLARGDVPGAISHPDERSLLAAVSQRIRDVDPDVLLGWNVVDFDVRVFTRRCEALRLPHGLGRGEGNVLFQQDPGFTRQTRAVVPGRMVLDGIDLVRSALRLEDYRLKTVAQAVLGRGKRIDPNAPDPAAEIARMFREDKPALVAYNREDARLALEILEREGLLELTRERSLLSGMQLDRVGASVASFDLLYLPELRRRGYVAPCVDAARKDALVHGGAVLDSKPGLFTDVALFDFQSLYPSLIRTFALDPLAHAQAGDDAIVAPNGARFAREGAILPEILERFIARRSAAKQRGDRHADQAIKIMMNALFGVLGAAGCRFFDAEIANAITSFGQQTLFWTREAFESEGVEVLYGDTDSVFVQLHAGGEAARHEAEALRERVEARVAARLREAYRVEPRLHLELECVYARFFMPRVRGGPGGSKKRYAGLREGTLELIGLEAVRRDWPAVARRLQLGLLERVFADADPLPFAREIAQRVRDGSLDAELVYARRVRKATLESYTEITPPHVQAARKAGASPGALIRYVVTPAGPEPVRPGRSLPGPIDHGHYVERVLRPIADQILEPLGRSFDEALGAPRQMSLL
ncbi:MAG TPA: DNA polymerase II [Myxococcota bacterium]|nr:DNA polymerase II [Myxococcota bacterium]